MSEDLNSNRNKQPAAIQITAEQLLREAHFARDKPKIQPRQRIADKDELLEYQSQKRTEFENAVRRNRSAIGAWLKYAQWEQNQDEMERARSIFERAIETDHRTPTLWLKYIEMEMKHKNVNRARNILDRVVMILPKVDVFWYKYTFMEELVQNPSGARLVFERWMQWDPSEEAWMAYVKFEIRHKLNDSARKIYKRFVESNPSFKNWIKWSKFEEGLQNIVTARKIYEECIETLGDAFIDQNFYISFAKFEIRQKEIERARAIYQYAIDKLPTGQKENLHNSYTLFEKQFGSIDGLEDVVLSKRRLTYEELIAENPYNYDVWFDYIKLEESGGRAGKIRQVYERAIANVPMVQEKKYWKRYVYIWIYYAVWEELVAQDFHRVKQIYTKILSLIPHSKFTFSKLWDFYAKFMIRQKDLSKCRSILGQALGKCPKEKTFKNYINLELSLREFDRCRKLYEKYLEWMPANVAAWIKYCELEKVLGDNERCRAIYELAIGQSELDLPEVLWKSFLEFETELECWSNARILYEKLLEKTSHIKVHISFANFELIALDNGDLEARLKSARKRFDETNSICKSNMLSSDRVMLLSAWLEFEKSNGNEVDIKNVEEKQPKSVKKRRRVYDLEGNPTGWEEYFDYVFPEDGNEKSTVKLLQMAHAWKQKSVAAEEQESDSSDED